MVLQKILSGNNLTIGLIFMIVAVINIATSSISISCYNDKPGVPEDDANYKFLHVMLGFSIGALIFGAYIALAK